jgi:hypothetical protein
MNHKYVVVTGSAEGSGALVNFKMNQFHNWNFIQFFLEFHIRIVKLPKFDFKWFFTEIKFLLLIYSISDDIHTSTHTYT